jgi:hypothetical protein
VISAQAAISRIRRDLTIGALLRNGLLVAAAVCIFSGPFAGTGFNSALLLMPIGAIWLMLGYRSARGSRLTAGSPLLIATGRYDEAETRIDAALKSFSLFKPAKLMSLHHLALLRHAQQRWQESAMLCRALLGQRLGALRGLSKPSTLLLADDLLHMGDLQGVYDALVRMYHQRLNLGEALALQQLQLEYLARVGAFEPMLFAIGAKAQLAELMPAGQSACTQALLALAALKTGRDELSQWLLRRAELLADARSMAAERPVLAELWPNLAASSDR